MKTLTCHFVHEKASAIAVQLKVFLHYVTSIQMVASTFVIGGHWKWEVTSFMFSNEPVYCCSRDLEECGGHIQLNEPGMPYREQGELFPYRLAGSWDVAQSHHWDECLRHLSMSPPRRAPLPGKWLLRG